MKHKKLGQRMGEEARKIAIDNFDSEHNSNKEYNLIQRIVKPKYHQS